MRDPRLEKLADVIVRYSTRVRRGDVVGIQAEPGAMPLIEALYASVLRAAGTRSGRRDPSRCTNCC